MLNQHFTTMKNQTSKSTKKATNYAVACNSSRTPFTPSKEKANLTNWTFKGGRR